MYLHDMRGNSYQKGFCPRTKWGFVVLPEWKFRPCVSHSSRKWLRARQKSKRWGLYWANLNSRVSKDIKTSQLKPGYVIWGRVLKELGLGVLRKMNGNFLIWWRPLEYVPKHRYFPGFWQISEHGLRRSGDKVRDRIAIKIHFWGLQPGCMFQKKIFWKTFSFSSQNFASNFLEKSFPNLL